MNLVHLASPWFLIGLLSLIIPFLILFVKARAYLTTNFSSIAFLSTVMEKASTVIEWKRILLLIVRLLILSLLALAFAMPFFKRGGFSFLGAPKQHLIFVIDNSYSMGYRQGERRLFEIAKEKVSSLVNETGARDTLFSLYAFNKDFDSLVIKSKDPVEVLDGLDKIQLSDFSSEFTAFAQGLETNILSHSKVNNQVYFYSDFSIPGGGDLGDIRNLLTPQQGDVHVHFIPIQPREYRNFVLSDILLGDRPLVPKEIHAIKVLYESHGYEPGSSVPLKLWAGAVEVGQVEIKLDETGSGVAYFFYEFPGPGAYTLRVESPPDDLETDNRRYAVATVANPVRLLVVEDLVYDYPFENPYFYFSRVVQSFVEGEKSPWVTIEKIGLEQLKSFPLDVYDLVLVADVNRLENAHISVLSYYVRGGGALFFAPGESFLGQPPKQNKALSDFLGGYFAEALASEGDGQNLSIGPVNYLHPLFAVFKDGRAGSFDGISVRTFSPFMPIESDSRYDILMWFGSKWPGLVERPYGEGKVFIWSTSLNDTWTDFPKTPVYVPFVLELIRYSSRQSSPAHNNLSLGDPIRFVSNQVFDYILVNDPTGAQLTFYPSKIDVSMIFTKQAGFYEWAGVASEQVERHTLACNVDAVESQPHFVPAERIVATEQEIRDQQQKLTERDRSKRQYIYSELFYVIFILLLLEVWLANRYYRPTWV